jgi:hypothetical protein
MRRECARQGATDGEETFGALIEFFERVDLTARDFATQKTSKGRLNGMIHLTWIFRK